MSPGYSGMGGGGMAAFVGNQNGKGYRLDVATSLLGIYLGGKRIVLGIYNTLTHAL